MLIQVCFVDSSVEKAEDLLVNDFLVTRVGFHQWKVFHHLALNQTKILDNLSEEEVIEVLQAAIENKSVQRICMRDYDYMLYFATGLTKLNIDVSTKVWVW